MIRGFVLVFSCFFYVSLYAQYITGTVKNQNGKELANATITVKRFGGNIVAFGFSDEKGFFSIRHTLNPKDSVVIAVSMLGYETEEKKVITELANTLQFKLGYRVKKLPDVFVRNSGIYTRGDTINYNVKTFLQKQDVVIGDVIKRLPGIEVAENGTIKYQGRAINKFYIEGLDLLEDKYTVANNNIPVNAVTEVQVLENHQPVKALDSFSNVTRAAINLILSNDAKSKIIGRAKVGTGLSPLLLDAELVPMMFAKKSQFIAGYKYNNAGINYNDELMLHNQSGFTDNIKAGTTALNILSIPFPASPNISKSRYTFNDQHVFSINNINQLNKQYSLRLNADLIKDIQTSEAGSTGKNYFQEDTVIINEYQKLLKRSDMLRIAATVSANTPKYFFQNIFRVNLSTNRYSANIYEIDTTAQKLHQTLHSFSNELQFIKSNNKWAQSYSSHISISNQPQKLIIEPGKYSFLLNEGENYNELSQSVNIKTFYTNNSITLIRKFKGFAIENRLGFSWQNQFFTGVLEKNTGDKKLILLDSFSNNLTAKEMELYYTATFNISIKKLKLNFAFPLTLINRSTDFLTAVPHATTLTQFIPSFNLNTEYRLNSFFRFYTDVSFTNTYAQPFLSHDGYILSNYRTLSNQNAIQKYYRYKNFELILSYKNVVTALFVNAGYTYSHNIASALNNPLYKGSLLFNNLREINATTKTQKAFASANKYFYNLKTSIGITVYTAKSFTPIFQENKISYFQNNTLGISANAETRIGFLNLNHQLAIQSIAAGYENKNVSDRYFINQKLRITANLPHSLMLSIIGEQNSFYDTSVKNHYLFADMSIRKKIASRKIDIELLWQNIFNLQSFQTVSINANTETYMYYRLRPTQIFFKIHFLL